MSNHLVARSFRRHEELPLPSSADLHKQDKHNDFDETANDKNAPVVFLMFSSISLSFSPRIYSFHVSRSQPITAETRGMSVMASFFCPL